MHYYSLLILKLIFSLFIDDFISRNLSNNLTNQLQHSGKFHNKLIKVHCRETYLRSILV